MMRGCFLVLLAFVVSSLPVLAADRKAPPWERPLRTGRYLYLDNCSVCHEVNKPESKKPGPVLHQIFQKEKMPFSGLPVTEDYIRIKIQVGGGIMPSFADKLTEDHVDKIILFLKSESAPSRPEGPNR